MQEKPRLVLFGIVAGLMAAVIWAPASARADDYDEAPVFRQLDPNDVDVSDVEIFGRDSGPVYGQRLAIDEPEEPAMPEETTPTVFAINASPAFDPRMVRARVSAPGQPMDVAEVEIYDPSADEQAAIEPEDVPTPRPDPAPVEVAAVEFELEPVEELAQIEETERDLYAQAEDLFRELHDNDIDISGVEIYGLDTDDDSSAASTEMAVVAPSPSPTITPVVTPNVDVEPSPAMRPDQPPTQLAGADRPVTVEQDRMDVAEVEIFELEQDPKSDEVEAREEAAALFAGAEDVIEQDQDDDSSYEMASVRNPAGPVPDVIDRSVGNREDRNSGFDSGAFQGLFSGVGVASGMRLDLEINGPNVHGWLIDSTGQVFTVGGEIATMDGHAQAAVVSDSAAIGYLDLQLTNLGLGALYVPLRDDMSPIVADAREYEFLRAMSAEAQAALAVGRAERLEILASQPNRDLRRRQVIWQEEDDPWD